MNEWNIQSRSHHCQACNKGFTDKQGYHTLLIDEKQELRRMDVCEACWQSQFNEGARDRKGFVSYWRGVYEAPPPPSPEPIQKDTAESLLRKIMELNDPAYAAASYILAVMLERKRLLKIKEQFVREGQRVFVYEQPRTGDLFTIPDPALQLNQLDQVQREVGILLEQGLVPLPAPGAADTAPAEPTAAAPAETPAAEPLPSEEAAPEAAESKTGSA